MVKGGKFKQLKNDFLAIQWVSLDFPSLVWSIYSGKESYEAVAYISEQLL